MSRENCCQSAPRRVIPAGEQSSSVHAQPVHTLQMCASVPSLSADAAQVELVDCKEHDADPEPSGSD